jgi:hypothetical protein
MSNMELVLNMLAEVTTKEISKKEDPNTFDKSRVVAKKGGGIVGSTRKNIEKELGKSIVNSKNAKQLISKTKKEIDSIK